MPWDDAFELPCVNERDQDIALQLDNIYFNYPTQPEYSGLKGESFKMEKGIITAVVGSFGVSSTIFQLKNERILIGFNTFCSSSSVRSLMKRVFFK